MLALEATGILTQDSNPGGTTIVDARNGFNDLIRLEMRWMVRQHWPSGEIVEFNCYKHCAKLLLYQPGDTPVILLRQ